MIIQTKNLKITSFGMSFLYEINNSENLDDKLVNWIIDDRQAFQLSEN